MNYTKKKYPFSRSYRIILPSSLDFIILYAFVYSTKLPESVISTVLI